MLPGRWGRWKRKRGEIVSFVWTSLFYLNKEIFHLLAKWRWAWGERGNRPLLWTLLSLPCPMVGPCIEADVIDPSVTPVSHGWSTHWSWRHRPLSLLCPMVGPCFEADVADPSLTPLSHGWSTHLSWCHRPFSHSCVPWLVHALKLTSQTLLSFFCVWGLCVGCSVQKYIFTEATVKLVTSLILSHLDYCNSLLCGLSASSVHSLCCIQNCAVWHILKRCKTDPITLLFQFLQCLPVQQRVYKINTLYYKCITGIALSYFCDNLQLYTPSHTVRSASDTLSLQIPRTRLHFWFTRFFCFWLICMKWPSLSYPAETLSWLIQR